jgi:DNA recombination-dependent growth factor C
MGLMSGGMSVRRFHVLAAPPKFFEVDYIDSFQDYAFRSNTDVLSEEIRCGWSTIHNLLDQDFSDSTRWYVEPYIFAMMRIDKKTVPSNYFRAKSKQKIEDWCAVNNKDNAPAKVRREIKESVKNDLLSKSLPKVKTVEFCWNVQESHLILHNTSRNVNEQFVKLFFETFGIGLEIFYPSLFVPDDRMRIQLESAHVSDMTFSGESDE